MDDDAHESRKLLAALEEMPGPDAEAVDRIYQRTVLGAGVIAASVATASTQVVGKAAASTAVGGKTVSASGIATVVSLKAKIIIGVALLASAGGGYGVRSLTEPTQVPTAQLASVAETANTIITSDTASLQPAPVERAEVPTIAKAERLPQAVAEAEPSTASEKVAKPARESMRKAKTKPAKALPSTAPEVESLATLARERMLLDRARRDLRDSDLAGAATTIEQHAREFSSGSLREERETLSVTLLLRRKDIEGAEKRARQFEMLYPTSLHLPRMKLELARAKNRQP